MSALADVTRMRTMRALVNNQERLYACDVVPGDVIVLDNMLCLVTEIEHGRPMTDVDCVDIHSQIRTSEAIVVNHFDSLDRITRVTPPL